MASLCWITIFACLPLFILPSRGDVVVFTRYLGYGRNEVYFPDTLFREFYQCLTNRQTASCTALYEYKKSFKNGSFLATEIKQRKMSPSNQFLYNCYPSNSVPRHIVCSKRGCDVRKFYQRFKFTTTGSFNDNCVEITSFEYFRVRTDDRFETCEGNCYDRSNTTTVTNTDVTTTVIPITAIPTTDIKTTVVTATSTLLTQDTTNLTESLKKEPSNENNTGIIVGVTVILVILIVAIVLAVFFWTKWKRNRRTPERNHHSSNFGMSRDNLNMDGYENTLNMRGEEILRTGQVASPDTYSNIDYRNQDTTINSNLNTDGYENTKDMQNLEVTPTGQVAFSDTYSNEHSRITADGNNLSSNSGISRDSMNIDGYENTVDMNFEEVPGNGPNNTIYTNTL